MHIGSAVVRWQTIDGFLSEQDAMVLAPLIQAVKEDGWIIEIGSFKGRQSSFIAENKKASVRLSCIDPFPDKLVHFDDSRTYQNYMFSEWRQNLEGFANVEAVRGFSPFNISFLSFSKIPDLIIFDVDAVFDSLVFWMRFTNSSTRFVIHTYKHEHQKIVKQIERAVHELGFVVEEAGPLAFLARGKP